METPFTNKDPLVGVINQVVLGEKKLTDAEMKKREEIVLAIKRENPDMEKSRAYAIATAQAKKVAEEVNLEEHLENFWGAYTTLFNEATDDKQQMMLLRAMAKDPSDLMKMKRAISMGDKALTNPVMRQEILKMLDQMMTITTDDKSILQKTRGAFQKKKRMAMPESVKHVFEAIRAKDKQVEGEYGYEGDMAMSQLRTIIRNCEEMMKVLDKDTDMPEWVQSKITLATDYLQTANDYLMSELEESHIKESTAGYQSHYDKHMNAHHDAVEAGDEEAADRHAKKAETYAARHFKETGKKIKDPGYTGTSKHIGEDLDEGSLNDTLSKIKRDWGTPPADHKKAPEKPKEKQKPFTWKIDRYPSNPDGRRYMGDSVEANGEAEQIDEISADTLQKYRVKAKAQSNADYQKVRAYPFSQDKGKPGKGKEMFNLLKKVDKRIKGVDKASARLGKTRFDEEAQIDEALQGSLSKSDYTSGARGKLADTNCKTCHGRKTVYKLDGKVYADNKSGSTKMKCSACDGTGNLKEEVVEEGLANLVKRTFKSVVDRIPPAHVLDPRRGEIPPATGQVSKQNVHHVAGDRSKAGFNKADLAKKYGTKNIVSEPVSKDVTITKKKGGGLTGTLMADMSNDDAALNEARFDHREAGSHGVIHSDSARHYKVGEHRDFYDHGTGDKKYGKVTRNDGKNIHIQHDGKVKKFTVGTNYPGLHDKKLDESADHEELKDLKSRGMKLTAQEMRRKFELERKLKGPKTDQEKEHERWERGYTRNRN